MAANKRPCNQIRKTIMTKPTTSKSISQDQKTQLTQGQLVKIIIEADCDLSDNVNTFGFSFEKTSGIYESAVRELAARFGKAVGYGGVTYSV